MLDASGRRLRRNYGWIFTIQAAACVGKPLMHPTPIASVAEHWGRAAVGPIPGQAALLIGLLFHGAWMAVAVRTLRAQRGGGRAHTRRRAADRTLDLATGRA